MPEPSVCEQPDMLRLDSPVSSDRGARSALRRMPWQCCSFSAVNPVRLPSGCSLHVVCVQEIAAMAFGLHPLAWPCMAL